MKAWILITAAVCIAFIAQPQSLNYDVELKPDTIAGMPGLHSYSFATHGAYWLVIGGRLDGLHARQPFNAFPSSYNNSNVLVFNTETKEVWSSTVSSLPASLEAQLQSTNMCFEQYGDTLYIAGGYGFSSMTNNHITHPYLTTIEVSPLIDAIKDGADINPYFKQIYDERMAVTGGHLARLDSKFMIVGGHRFDGRYNPLGHNTYTQSYTDAIRSFLVDNSGASPVISDFEETTDASHLHRRDYNLLPQVFGDGNYGYMISSGVFQTNVDLPYLYPVEIRSNGHTAITSFNQYLSNYHSAHLTLYDTALATSHSIFFGGMAQYYYEDTVLIEDQGVPFVKTISCVTRTPQDELEEFVLPSVMPDLIGSSAEFIPNHANDFIHHEMLLLDGSDSILAGYIYGGIQSSLLNPFNQNSTSSTEASPVVYEVWLKRKPWPVGIPMGRKFTFITEVYPNPSAGRIHLKTKLPESGTLFIQVIDVQGRTISEQSITGLSKGKNDLEFTLPDQLPSGPYNLNISLNRTYFSSESLLLK